MDGERSRLSFLGRRLAASFASRTVVVAPGRARVFDADEWRDALVVLERGQLELLYRDGSRQCFGHGAVLWLEGLPLRALLNRGPRPAVLVAVSRRAKKPNDPRRNAKEHEE